MEGAEFGRLIHEISTWVLPILFAITLHEAAHGYVAWRLGDDTAYRLGRVTFNPLKHIDPFGTVILPALLLALGGFVFGWAKPVPVNFRKLRNFRRDTLLVAAAGPLSNLLLAIAAAILAHGLAYIPDWVAEWASATLVRAILINVMLAVFNMLPLLPLDGGRVVGSLLPPALARSFYGIERHGFMLLILLIFILPWIGSQIGVDLNILGWILYPASAYVGDGVLALAGHEVSFKTLLYCVDSGEC